MNGQLACFVAIVACQDSTWSLPLTLQLDLCQELGITAARPAMAFDSPDSPPDIRSLAAVSGAQQTGVGCALGQPGHRAGGPLVHDQSDGHAGLVGTFCAAIAVQNKPPHPRLTTLASNTQFAALGLTDWLSRPAYKYEAMPVFVSFSAVCMILLVTGGWPVCAC